ncbi:MAG: hypothetical protein ACRDOJ_05075 [Nocardioidaceae bacterium]
MGERSPDQQAADDALETAVDAWWRAYYEGPGMLIEWVAVAAVSLPDASLGDVDRTAVLNTVSRNLPKYRMLGLLRTTQAEVEAQLVEGDDGD